MKLFKLFKSKAREDKALDNPIEMEAPDEEYQLPVLLKGDFSFTAELRRRQENEMLMKRYGIVLEKTGEFR